MHSKRIYDEYKITNSYIALFLDTANWKATILFYNQKTIECEKSGKLIKCFTKVSVAYIQDYADITLNTNNNVIYFTIGPLLIITNYWTIR